MSLVMEPTPETRTGFRIKGWHVLAALLAFFGVTIAVNGVFVFLALDTWTGLTTERSYQEGLTYNRQIEESAALSAAGWRFDLRQEGRQLAFLAVKKEGEGEHLVDGLAPRVELRRPTNDKEDLDLAMTALGEGRYGAALEGLGEGAWLARVIVSLDGREGPVVETRLWLD